MDFRDSPAGGVRTAQHSCTDWSGCVSFLGDLVAMCCRGSGVAVGLPAPLRRHQAWGGVYVLARTDETREPGQSRVACKLQVFESYRPAAV